MKHQVFERLNTFLKKAPKLNETCYIAQGAVVIGDVEMGPYSSVWFNSVVRADINFIKIGEGSNIQDNSVIHLADDYPCVIGDYVTVGHSAIIHACKIGNNCLIGMGATILDGAEIGDDCIVGANALVTGGTKIPNGSMALGAPAKIVRSLSKNEIKSIKPWAEKYIANSQYYKKTPPKLAKSHDISESLKSK